MLVFYTGFQSKRDEMTDVMDEGMTGLRELYSYILGLPHNSVYLCYFTWITIKKN